MSEKAAKAERKAIKAEDIAYVVTIRVLKSGGFEMEVPQGASIPTTMDVLMRCQGQVWNTFLTTLQKQAAAKKLVQPVGGIPEGLLRREPK